jgi:hypothetical protein
MDLCCNTDIPMTTVKFGSQLSEHAKTVPWRIVVLYHLHNLRVILHSKTVLHSKRLSVTIFQNEQRPICSTMNRTTLALTIDCPSQSLTTNWLPQKSSAICSHYCVTMQTTTRNYGNTDRKFPLYHLFTKFHPNLSAGSKFIRDET